MLLLIAMIKSSSASAHKLESTTRGSLAWEAERSSSNCKIPGSIPGHSSVLGQDIEPLTAPDK